MNLSEIRTIRRGEEVKFKEKGSLFLSQPFSIENEQSASEILREIKKKYFDASHHCYAWRLSDGSFKSSDDGEPAGTAGLRIMNAIDHYDLTNLIVIVTRWFGGTKLGIGPLGKAYFSAADNSLASAETITLHLYIKVEVKTGFELLNSIHKLVNDTGSRISNISYSDNVVFNCLVKQENLNEFAHTVTDFSKGSAEINISGGIYLI
jgi:uncharacterized YigZ family protein